MAGPPLVPSAAANIETNTKPQEKVEEPCSKRRRKSGDHPATTQHTDEEQAEGNGEGEQQAAGASGVTGGEDEESGDDDAGADMPEGKLVNSGNAQAGDTSKASSGRGSQDGADGVSPEPDDTVSGGVEDAHRDVGGRSNDDEEDEEEEEEEEEGGDVEDEQDGESEGDEPEEESESGGASGAAGVASGVADGSKIARARSGWMLFLADNREKVRKVNPGLPIGPMQKILSEMWRGLDEAETARYSKLAEEDKARMKKELEAAGLSRLPAKKSNFPAAVPGGPMSLVLPLARVRKTVRLDPSVGNISKEGLLLVTKATEVFMAMMADKAWKIGRQTGRKSVRPCDVADFVFATPKMYWLRDEFRSERSSVKKHKPDSGGKAAAAKKANPVAKGTKSIASFFQKKA